jgi:hypothetical protein
MQEAFLRFSSNLAKEKVKKASDTLCSGWRRGPEFAARWFFWTSD